MDPLQDKRVPLAWGPLPLQPLLGGRSCSCLGHGEGRRTGKVERPPQTLKGLEVSLVSDLATVVNDTTDFDDGL